MQCIPQNMMQNYCKYLPRFTLEKSELKNRHIHNRLYRPRFCMRLGHEHTRSSTGIEGEGQRSRSTPIPNPNAVGLTFILIRGPFCSSGSKWNIDDFRRLSRVHVRTISSHLISSKLK